MCPTAISMNAYVLRIHILPYVVELSGELGFPRNPDTGLARANVPIRYLDIERKNVLI